MLMHRLNTTMDINVTQIMPRRPCEVHNGELALHNGKPSVKTMQICPRIK